jgi:hypothetical protein
MESGTPNELSEIQKEVYYYNNKPKSRDSKLGFKEKELHKS